MVPATFFSDAVGASVGPVAADQWRLLYFGKQIDFYTRSTRRSRGWHARPDAGCRRVFMAKIYMFRWARFATWLGSEVERGAARSR